MFSIRFAACADEQWLAQHDHHVEGAVLRTAIERGHILMALRDGRAAGWLRYNLFWDNTPFLNMLYLLENDRGQGGGTALMKEWEEDMRALQYDRLLVSTQANETSQHFYRKLGFEDVGGFLLPGDSYELILCKELK